MKHGLTLGEVVLQPKDVNKDHRGPADLPDAERAGSCRRALDAQDNQRVCIV